MKVNLADANGLEITELIRDGVDVRGSYAKLRGIDPKGLSLRIYPTNLQSKSADGSSKYAWRAIMQDQDAFADAGTPTCVSWMAVDIPRYGGEALDRFVFGVDKDGAAKEVEIPALRMMLKRL
jgi:hypothetical protein